MLGPTAEKYPNRHPNRGRGSTDTRFLPPLIPDLGEAGRRGIMRPDESAAQRSMTKHRLEPWPADDTFDLAPTVTSAGHAYRPESPGLVYERRPQRPFQAVRVQMGLM